MTAAARLVVWWASIDETCGEQPVCARQWSLLDEGERARALRLHKLFDRRRFVAAHALTRRLLGRVMVCAPADLTFTTSVGGKPALSSGGPDFSLTHTTGLVACAAVEQGRVGLDAERIDPLLDYGAIARQHFTPSEIRLVEGDARAFYRMWTLKEATLKAMGKGLQAKLSDLEFDLTPPCLRRLGGEAFVGAGEIHLAQWQPTCNHILAIAVDEYASTSPPLLELRAAPLDGLD